MEKINNIFLNYKTYSAFLRDLNADKISPNSIAFIQDKKYIWAHGVEYSCNALTLTKSRYDRMVENGEIDPHTYYFTYEGEEPTPINEETWHFGDSFPIILTDNWAFGGTFPITLM